MFLGFEDGCVSFDDVQKPIGGNYIGFAISVISITKKDPMSLRWKKRGDLKIAHAKELY